MYIEGKLCMQKNLKIDLYCNFLWGETYAEQSRSSIFAKLQDIVRDKYFQDTIKGHLIGINGF